MDKIAFERQIKQHREAIRKGQIEISLQALISWELELEDTLQIAEVCSDIILVATIQSDLELVNSYSTKFADLLKDEKQIPTRLRGFLAYEMTRNKRKSDKGFALLGACIEELPNVYELYLLRALGHHFLGNHESALLDLERADQLSKDNIFIISMMGDCHYYMNAYLPAEQLHKQALKLNPFFRRSLICMGLILMETHRPSESSEFFLRMIGPEPMNWFSHGCVGDILFESKGKSLQSLPYYAAAIISGHVHVATCFNLSSGFIALGKYQEAYRVLSLCNKGDLKYNKQSDLSTIHYIQMALDIAIHPHQFDRDKIIHIALNLKQRNFKILQSLLLLHFEIYSLDYLAPSEEILERFAYIIPTTETEPENSTTVSSYELIIRTYLENKKQRTASQEELLVIIMIARGLIWGGFIYEGKLLVNLLLKSKDAYASDAGDILLQELYEHEAASRRSGVVKQEIYEFFLKKGLPQWIYQSEYKGSLVETTREANHVLANAMFQSANYDFAQSLFEFRFTDSCGAALSENNTTKLRANLVSRYYDKLSIAKANGVALNLGDVPIERDTEKADETFSNALLAPELGSSTSKFLDALMSSYLADPILTNVEKGNHHEILQTLIEQGDSNLLDGLGTTDWKASNDDDAEYANDSDRDMGEGPLLFATEGSAFRRYLPVIDYTPIDAGNITEHFQAMLTLAIETEIRSIDTPNHLAPEQVKTWMADLSQSVAKRCEEMWRNLHGHKLPVAINGLIEQLSLGVLEKISLKHPLTAFYRQLFNHQPDLTPSFPESPLIVTPLLCQKQQPTVYPKSANILRQIVPFNRLTYLDLLESIFNRAVFAVESYNEKQDPEALNLFFGKQPVFDWYAMYGKKRLETCRELGREISKYLARSQKGTDITNLHFGLGVKNTPFAQQFSRWAQGQAKQVLPICIKLENDIRNSASQQNFVIFHQAQKLIQDYPYLSRLYLVVAGLYARIGKRAQVLFLINQGMEWEDRLYCGAGHWQAVDPENKGLDKAMKFQYCPTEIGECAAIWTENLHESAEENLIYHYIDIDDYFKMRRRELPETVSLVARESLMDKGGCYEYYRIFKNYILSEDEIYTAFADCLITDGIYSLQDVITHCLKVLSDPYIFPFRHQLAEYLHQIYPKTKHTALARFYSENMQPVNSFVHAAYDYFANPHLENDDPDNSAMNLGCVLYDLGYLTEAIEYLDEAIKLPKAPSMAYLTRGCVAIEIGEFEEAIEILRKGIERDPKSDRFYYNTALALIELKRYEDAEVCLKTGLELTHFALDIESQLMRVYIKADRYLDAINTAKRLENKSKIFFLESIDNPEFAEFKKIKAIQDLINR